jgi:hypothetical protein
VSPKPRGPRFPELPHNEVDAYDNLILLCSEDHTLIDKAPDAYPETALRELKRLHEEEVRSRGKPPTALRIRDPRPGEPLALRRIDGGGVGPQSTLIVPREESNLRHAA